MKLFSLIQSLREITQKTLDSQFILEYNSIRFYIDMNGVC